MEGEERRNSLRSFLLGGALGAAATLATASRRRNKPPRRARPAGLAAFEDAPCYRELAEKEDGARQHR